MPLTALQQKIVRLCEHHERSESKKPGFKPCVVLGPYFIKYGDCSLFPQYKTSTKRPSVTRARPAFQRFMTTSAPKTRCRTLSWNTFILDPPWLEMPLKRLPTLSSGFIGFLLLLVSLLALLEAVLPTTRCSRTLRHPSLSRVRKHCKGT